MLSLQRVCYELFFVVPQTMLEMRKARRQRVESNCNALSRSSEHSAEEMHAQASPRGEPLPADNPRLILLTRGSFESQCILSENGHRCAKYSCSGQVEGTPTLIHPLPPSHDLGFCRFTLSQTTLSGPQSPPKVPRTGIFCAFGREKRQHDSRMETEEETLKNRRLSVNDGALREQGRATSPYPEAAT